KRMEEGVVKWIAGFWRRIGALILDSLILGAFGFLLSIFLKDYFYSLGDSGVLVGLAVGLVYFGLLNSSLCVGQTLGKRIVKIKVVNKSNQLISLPKSLIRYLIYSIPFSLNGLAFGDEDSPVWVMCILSLVVFGGLLSIIYLYIFNRNTRQSLHDLVVGSYVVRCDADYVEPVKIWGVHFLVIVGLFIASLILPIVAKSLVETEPFAELLEVQKSLKDIENIVNIGVKQGTSTTSVTGEETRTVKYLSVQAVIASGEVDNVDVARDIALKVVGSYAKSMENDVIRVTLTHGYSIGIWSEWTHHNHAFNPSEFE
ncbi:MAG: RDD family protein, partial [Pseudomonadales bacterium]|nr:RDD family protein [Pseudomonadales bacterium]